MPLAAQGLADCFFRPAAAVALGGVEVRHTARDCMAYELRIGGPAGSEGDVRDPQTGRAEGDVALDARRPSLAGSGAEYCKACRQPGALAEKLSPIHGCSGVVDQPQITCFRWFPDIGCRSSRPVEVPPTSGRGTSASGEANDPAGRVHGGRDHGGRDHRTRVRIFDRAKCRVSAFRPRSPRHSPRTGWRRDRSAAVAPESFRRSSGSIRTLRRRFA